MAWKSFLLIKLFGAYVMKMFKVQSLEEFLRVVPDKKGETIIFRGQREKKNLLPKIARPDPTKDTEQKEKDMLTELRRRGAMLLGATESDWELLVRAQHFGMQTRLLDWTSNPLAALWFACSNEDATASSYVYAFTPDAADFLNPVKHASPFTAPRTLVLKPTLNNPRIVAQHGWFTAHVYVKKQGRFVALNKNTLLTDKVFEIEVPGGIKKGLMAKLDTLGANAFTLFSDFEGLCRYVNWLYS
jgi:hypothetical protein